MTKEPLENPNFDTPPRSFEELCQRADKFRQKIVDDAAGLRWCWIAEYDSDIDGYWLGVQYDGRCSWTQFGLLQQGHGSTANDWTRRLNDREGTSSEEERKIRNSYTQSAKACLDENEANVCIMIQGAVPDWDVAPSAVEMARQFWELPEDPIVYPLRHIFTLEPHLANDVASCLAQLHQEHRLPKPCKDIRDVDVVQVEDSGDTTFSIPSELEIDPHDYFCFTLMLDLQTAADLYAVMQEKFWY